MSPPVTAGHYPARFVVRDNNTGDSVQTFPGTYQGRRDARRLADDLWNPQDPERYTWEPAA